MRQVIKTVLVLSVMSALAACSLPWVVPTLTPTWVPPLPPPTALQPSPFPTAVQPSPLPTAAPTMTPTSPFGDWSTYTNQKYGFSVRYPQGGQVTNPTDSSARIQLPFVQDTNLREKFLDVSVAENLNPCSSPNALQYTPGMIPQQQVTINNLPFILESGSDAGAGNIYDWTAYSIVKGNACVSLAFVLHSGNIQNYATPPAAFDPNAESAVFADIVSTFTWLNP